VITGKGAPRQHRSGSEYDDWSSPEPGVLRRQVPHWLSEPDLRAIVVSFTTAAAQHGGDGALYVHLRRVDRVV
jgi:DNA-nicking Smr family endonuclease